jgi:uncharacterized protein
MAVMVRTFSEKWIDVERFEASNFDPRDVARSLSMQCRFNGHVRQFYSVAEHCLLVADLCHGAGIEAEAWGLLHDAAEAWLGDVVRPIRKMTPSLDAIEDSILQVIARAMGLSWPIPDVVWKSDNQMLATEAVQLLRVRDDELRFYGGEKPVNVALRCRLPFEAETAFMTRFQSIQNRLAEVR